MTLTRPTTATATATATAKSNPAGLLAPGTKLGKLRVMRRAKRNDPAPLPEGPIRASGKLPRRKTQGPLMPLSMRLRPARPIPSTTRQVEILNTAVVAAPTGHEGVLIGRDRLSGSSVSHDPFTAYEKGWITSPNVVVLGLIGSGKSSLLKTVYGLRPLTLRNRRAVIIDRKPRGAFGEYTDMVNRQGGAALRLTLDGTGSRVNPLDRVIYQGAGEEAQHRLLRAIAEIARGDGAPLTPWEEKAIRLARVEAGRIADSLGRTPYLDDFVPCLGRITNEIRQQSGLSDLSPAALDRLHQAGVEMRFVYEGVVQEHLSGMFNGPTSKEVTLASTLTSFDVSQLPEDGPAVPLAVSTAHLWLMGMLRHQPGFQTYFLGEEGWHLLEGPGGRLMRSNQKLCRALGLSNVFAFHHIADVDPTSPGMSVIREAQTIHIYRQDRQSDIDAVITEYDLSPASGDTLSSLPNGEHLLKIGSRPEIRVQHLRSPIEVEITDTNEAMVTTRKA